MTLVLLLGGVTGDCLGAVVEPAETLAMIVVLALR
jgi:cobalamin synthase